MRNKLNHHAPEDISFWNLYNKSNLFWSKKKIILYSQALRCQKHLEIGVSNITNHNSKTSKTPCKSERIPNIAKEKLKQSYFRIKQNSKHPNVRCSQAILHDTKTNPKPRSPFHSSPIKTIGTSSLVHKELGLKITTFKRIG